MELSVRVVWSVVNIIFLSYLLADGHMLFWGIGLLADRIYVVWRIVFWLMNTCCLGIFLLDDEHMLFGEFFIR